jgi:hypothetical protein
MAADTYVHKTEALTSGTFITRHTKHFYVSRWLHFCTHTRSLTI